MRMASSAAGSSSTRAMRLRSSRQERPAPTSRRVFAEAMTVELPLEPEARTVMRIGFKIRRSGVDCGVSVPGWVRAELARASLFLCCPGARVGTVARHHFAVLHLIVGDRAGENAVVGDDHHLVAAI